MTRFSYGARPATSLINSRTKAVRPARWPLVRETRGARSMGVVFWGESCQLCLYQPPPLTHYHRAAGEASAQVGFQRRTFKGSPPALFRGLRRKRGGEGAKLTWPLLRPRMRPFRSFFFLTSVDMVAIKSMGGICLGRSIV